MPHNIKAAGFWSIVSILVSTPALANENRYEQQLSEIWSRFTASPTRIDAETDLIEMFELWDVVPKENILVKLEKAATFPKVARRAAERAKFLLAQADAKQGHIDDAEHRIRELGFLENWVLAGPFDNEGGTGLSHPYPPELFDSGVYDTETPMPGKDSEVAYQPSPPQIAHWGYLHIETFYSPKTNICAYGIKTLSSATGGDAILRVGAGGAVRAFWNGRQAVMDDSYRRPDPDRFAAEIRIRKGTNRLVIKVCKEEKNPLGFYARVTDIRSKPWPLTEPPSQMDALALPVKAGVPCRPRPQPLEKLVERAKKRTNNPKWQNTAARYLVLTKAVDGSSNLARDFARSACLKKPKESVCLLWANLALDPNEARNAIAMAKINRPPSIPILLARAKLEESGIAPEHALLLVSQALDIDRGDPLALSKKAHLLGNQGLPSWGLKTAHELIKIHPKLPVSVKTEIALARQVGNRKKERELRIQSLAFDYTNTDNLEALALFALVRDDQIACDRHLEALTRIAPHDKETYYLKANLQRGFGNEQKAIAMLETLTNITPREANAWRELGILLIQTGDPEKGIRALKTASLLQPQDAWLADYLTFLSPQKSFEHEYEIAPKTFLSLRGQENPGGKSIHLVDQFVVRVFDSGLSSRFVQRVTEIGSKADARDLREQWIQFSEANQRVKIIAARVFRQDGTIEKAVGRSTIPVSEPWYRLYYDIEAELLELPPLVPGDVVELKYKIDDIATRNIFNDYFGDFVFIKEEIPKRIWRYVLIHTNTKNIYVNDLSASEVQIAKKTHDNLVHEIFEARDIQGIRKEPDMPGSSTIAPYLHLSTYESWDELGAWYLGLIRNQLVPDRRIKEKVRTLTSKMTTPLEKVNRIYEWVITSTRYVGLEFGIHGFKPYRAPLVISRGFGDCKDKAALMVTMLRYAGIDAEFILIRTRNLGALSPFPASLAVFNHAIVHVPSLDLWLDGTAEHHGPDELPFGDQDSNALRLTDTKTLFVRTPVMPPGKNATVRRQRITLDNLGNAHIESITSMVGIEATQFRRELEVVQTRKDRFEAALTKTFPGAELLELHLEPMDLSKPVEYRYVARVPGYAKISSQGMEIPISVRKTLASKYAKLSSREYDLIIGPPMKDTQEVVLGLPLGYAVLYLPDKKTISSQFGDFSFEIGVEDGVVKFNHTLLLKTHRIAAKDYPRFANFCREVDTILSGRIRIGKTP